MNAFIISSWPGSKPNCKPPCNVDTLLVANEVEIFIANLPIADTNPNLRPFPPLSPAIELVALHYVVKFLFTNGYLHWLFVLFGRAKDACSLLQGHTDLQAITIIPLHIRTSRWATDTT